MEEEEVSGATSGSVDTNSVQLEFSGPTSTFDFEDDDPLKSIQAQIVKMIEVIEQARLAELPEEEIDGLILHLEDLIVIASVLSSFDESPSPTTPTKEGSIPQEPNLTRIDERNPEVQNNDHKGAEPFLPPIPQRVPKSTSEKIMENLPVFNTGYLLTRSAVHLGKNERTEALESLLNALKSGAVTGSLAISLIMPFTASGVLAASLIGGIAEASAHGFVEGYKLSMNSPQGLPINSGEKEEIVYDSINRIPGIGLLYGLGRSIYFLRRKDKEQLKSTGLRMSFNLVSTALTGFAIRRAWKATQLVVTAPAAGALTELENEAIKNAEKAAATEEGNKWVNTGSNLLQRSVETIQIGMDGASRLRLDLALRSLFGHFMDVVREKVLTPQNVMDFQETLISIMMCILIEYSNNSNEITKDKVDEIVDRELRSLPLVNFCYNLLKVIYLSLLSTNTETIERMLENGKESIQKSLERLCNGHIGGPCLSNCSSDTPNENNILLDQIRSQIVNKVFTLLNNYNNP